MSKYKSRATRAAEAAGALYDAASSLREIDIYENHEGNLLRPMADVVAQAKQALESVGSDEIEALQEEMESWRDNMSGTNLETTSKYERVDEAASSLEDIASTVGDLDAAPEPEEGESVEDYHSRLLEIADELENATSDLEGVDFPGAFG